MGEGFGVDQRGDDLDGFAPKARDGDVDRDLANGHVVGETFPLVVLEPFRADRGFLPDDQLVAATEALDFAQACAEVGRLAHDRIHAALTQQSDVGEADESAVGQRHIACLEVVPEPAEQGALIDAPRIIVERHNGAGGHGEQGR